MWQSCLRSWWTIEQRQNQNQTPVPCKSYTPVPKFARWATVSRFHNFPKQCLQLGTKYSNIPTFGHCTSKLWHPAPAPQGQLSAFPSPCFPYLLASSWFFLLLCFLVLSVCLCPTVILLFCTLPPSVSECLCCFPSLLADFFFSFSPCPSRPHSPFVSLLLSLCLLLSLPHLLPLGRGQRSWEDWMSLKAQKEKGLLSCLALGNS